MIPTIETIVEELLAGKITRQQAIAWLYMHASGAADEDRKFFTGQALVGILACSKDHTNFESPKLRVDLAVQYADLALAKLKERT